MLIGTVSEMLWNRLLQCEELDKNTSAERPLRRLSHRSKASASLYPLGTTWTWKPKNAVSVWDLPESDRQDTQLEFLTPMGSIPYLFLRRCSFSLQSLSRCLFLHVSVLKKRESCWNEPRLSLLLEADSSDGVLNILFVTVVVIVFLFPVVLLQSPAKISGRPALPVLFLEQTLLSKFDWKDTLYRSQ